MVQRQELSRESRGIPRLLNRLDEHRNHHRTGRIQSYPLHRRIRYPYALSSVLGQGSGDAAARADVPRLSLCRVGCQHLEWGLRGPNARTDDLSVVERWNSLSSFSLAELRIAPYTRIQLGITMRSSLQTTISLK